MNIDGENMMNTNHQKRTFQGIRHRTSERRGSLELHNGKWRIVALVNGEKIRISTGTNNREEAERIQREVMSQFTARDAVAQAEKLADAVKTAEAKAEAAAKRAQDALPALRISDALKAYLDDFTRKSELPTTAGTDENVALCLKQLSKWIADHHPECVEMRQFTPAMAEEYARYLSSALAASTSFIRLSTIKRVWKVLREKARCKEDPWSKVRMKRGASRRRENFTPEQIDAIFAKLEPGTELHALCTIGRYTGLRLSDAATLKWSAIDLKNNMIELVPLKVKKYGQPVRIPIHESLRSVLMALPEKDEYVLPDSARSYLRRRKSLLPRIAALLKSAGLDINEKIDGYAYKSSKYGFHSFRHSFVSMCADTGVPLTVVQALVGHLDSSMTAHYYHLTDSVARNAIAKLPGADSKAVKAEPSKVDEAVKVLAGLSKNELMELREKLDALIA